MSVVEINSAMKRLDFDPEFTAESWDKNLNVVNYHRHDTNSNIQLPDSCTSVLEFAQRTEELGGEYLFCTNHGAAWNWPSYYEFCRNTENEHFREKNGLKYPLKFRYAFEGYFVKDHTAKIEKTDKKGNTKTIPDDTNCHIMLVARTYTGLRKLNYISSVAQESQFYRRPRIDFDLLFTLNPEDVYITSACVAGWAYGIEESTNVWLKVFQRFGSSFFLEYQCNNTERQKEVNRRCYELSQKYGIKTIVGLDTHYLSEEDRIRRETLLARKHMNYGDNETGWYLDYPDGKTLFRRFLEQDCLPREEILYAMLNTYVFCKGCDEIELDTKFKVPIPPQYKDKTYEERAQILHDYLYEEYEKERYHSEDREKAIEYEFGEDYKSGIVDYFLCNTEVVQKAVGKYGGVLTPTSRGSSAAYYTNKLLKFTTIDRFEFNVPLLPQRFSTADRILAGNLADIDLNCTSQKPFIAAAREVCGEHGAYNLIAIQKWQTKAAFKAYAAVHGLSPSLSNDITTQLDAYNSAVKHADDGEEVKIEDFVKDPEHRKLLNESKRYCDIVDGISPHRCAVLLFNGNPRHPENFHNEDIRYEIGVIRCIDKKTKEPIMCVNVEGSLLDHMGYMKNDYLLVDTLGLINEMYTSIGERVPTVSELNETIAHDPGVFKIYEEGLTCCVNQVEKASTTKKVMKYKPTSVNELSMFIAAIRPGFASLLDGFLERIRYTTGEPTIDAVLESSDHYLIYQESIMVLLNYLGISLVDAYPIIKSISKKTLVGEKLENVQKIMKAGWMDKIGNLDHFDSVFQVIKDSARYSFNLSHSLSMAFDSLYEANFKYHHLSKFYEVALNYYARKGDKNKIQSIEDEAVQKCGYKIGQYRFGNDNSRFVVDDETKTIYPDLSSVKNIGTSVADSLNKLNPDEFKNFAELYFYIHAHKEVNVGDAVLEKLIRINYFERYGTVRKVLGSFAVCQKYGKNKTLKKNIFDKMCDELKIKPGTKERIIEHCLSDLTRTGKHSATTWTYTNRVDFCAAISQFMPSYEFPSPQRAAWEYSILGYTHVKDSNVNWHYVLITSLDTKYSPRFTAYCINNGKTCEMRIHKKRFKNGKNCAVSWEQEQFEEGQIVLLRAQHREPALKKVDDKWVKDESNLVWWVTDYVPTEIKGLTKK